MQNHIDYIFVGGPLHGQMISDPYLTGLGVIPPSCADALMLDSPLTLEAYRHAGSNTLRVAAKCGRSADDCTRYIVLHPQATGEQFLTIFAT